MDPPIGNGYRLPTSLKLAPSTTATPEATTTTMCNTTKCHRKRNVVSGSRNNQTVSSAANKPRSRSHNAHAHTQTHQLKAAKGFTGKQTPSIVPRATTMTRMRHQVGSLSFVLTLMAVVILNNFGCLISPTATTQVYAAASAHRENTRILPLQSGKFLKK
uniref:Uncharacterized protein n=1 Tax=Musca domestica TaxID=7370 RepID=A0A1I8MPM8_MUSDO